MWWNVFSFLIPRLIYLFFNHLFTAFFKSKKKTPAKGVWTVDLFVENWNRYWTISGPINSDGKCRRPVLDMYVTFTKTPLTREQMALARFLLTRGQTSSGNPRGNQIGSEPIGDVCIIPIFLLTDHDWSPRWIGSYTPVPSQIGRYHGCHGNQYGQKARMKLATNPTKDIHPQQGMVNQLIGNPNASTSWSFGGYSSAESVIEQTTKALAMIKHQHNGFFCAF